MTRMKQDEEDETELVATKKNLKETKSRVQDLKNFFRRKQDESENNTIT